MLGNFKTIKIMKLAVTHLFENKQFNCTFLSVTSPVWQQAHNNCSKRPCTRLLALKLNYLPMAYSLSNNYTKNYRNRATAIEIIVEGCVAYFFAIQCISRRYLKNNPCIFSDLQGYFASIARYIYDSYIWRCPHSMRSRVYVTLGCPSVLLSVCLSRQSTAAAACGWFTAERPSGAAYQESSDVCCRRPRSAANAGSVLLRAGDKVQHRLVFYRSTWIARIDRLNRLTRSIRNARWHWVDGTCRSDMKKMLLRFFVFVTFLCIDSLKSFERALKTLVEIEQYFKWYLTSFAALPNSLFLLITLSKSTDNASW